MSENTMCSENTNRNKYIELPEEFTAEVMEIIKRIEHRIAAGVLYLKNDTLVMYTVPQGTQVILSARLPQLNKSMKAAVLEVDVLDELISYRIITKKDEISVVTGLDFTAVAVHRKIKSLWASKNKEQFKLLLLALRVNEPVEICKLVDGVENLTYDSLGTLSLGMQELGIAVIFHNNMKVITNLLKDALDEHLVRTTAAINSSNPMVDRIMDDESVEGVIMANKEGAPILTNVSVTHATLYGRVLHKYGVMSMTYMTELDPLDEILVIRIQTKKNEFILTPHREFLIIIIQHSRKNTKVTNVSKR